MLSYDQLNNKKQYLCSPIIRGSSYNPRCRRVNSDCLWPDGTVCESTFKIKAL